MSARYLIAPDSAILYPEANATPPSAREGIIPDLQWAGAVRT